MIAPLGDIAITLGLICGVFLTVIGGIVAMDDRPAGRITAAIGIVMFGVSLWTASH